MTPPLSRTAKLLKRRDTQTEAAVVIALRDALKEIQCCGDLKELASRQIALRSAEQVAAEILCRSAAAI